MTGRLRLNLSVLLPDVPDARDACVARLVATAEQAAGIEQAHVVDREGSPEALLCLHYDPERVSLAEVERLARRAGADVTKRFGHAVLTIRLVEAEDGGPRLERALLDIKGVLHASANAAAHRVRVEFDRDAVSLDAVRSELQRLGYEVGSPSPSSRAADGTAQPPEVSPKRGWYARNHELAWSLASGVFLVAGWIAGRSAGMTGAVTISLFVVAYVFGAFDLIRHWVAALRKGRVSFDIDLLMLIAAVGAAALGEWLEGALLLFLFSFGHALEHYALGRARGAIRALAELAPATATLIRDGRQLGVPMDQVAVGDVVLVKPGERIPVDGSIRDGRSAVDQAPITGESVPVEKAPGDTVFAGTVNGQGALEVTTTGAAGDRTLDRVIKLVEEAQTQKAPTQRFTERFERIFVPLVLLGAALLIVVPPLLGVWSWSTSIYRGLALLVAASPCALALGTPAAVLTGIAQAARRGVLIKGGAHLENLGTVRAMALDKTGTLTAGEPEVTDLLPLSGVREKELLGVAAAVERKSQHPLAEAVVRRAESDSLDLAEAGELESVTARGVRSMVSGQIVEIGSLGLWDDGGVTIPDDVRSSVKKLQDDGRSTMVVRHGERWLGVIGVADRPRPGVRQVLDDLRKMGVRPLVMLTGDNRGVGEAIAWEVGVDEVRAELLPEDKVTAISELRERYGAVAMVGDGVNDAPALANATVGIAMGGAGTAVALETADVALMGDDLTRLPFAVGLARTASGVIRQNLMLSMAVILVLVISTATGLVNIGPAVAVHEGSTLVVIANALRLLRYEGPRLS